MTTGRRSRTAARWLSLEYKLPLLITALLVGTLAAGGTFAYLEVRGATLQAGRERLRLLAYRVGDVLRPLVQERVDQLREIAGDPAIVDLLSSTSSATRAAAEARLAGLEGQVARAVVVRDEKLATVAHRFYPGGGALPSAAESTLLAPLPDSASHGRFFVHEGQAYYWLTAPVTAGDEVIGYVSEMRPVRAQALARQLAVLLGEDVAIRFAHSSGDLWVALDGSARPAPPEWPFRGAARYSLPARGAQLANAQRFGGTSWYVIAQQPVSLIAARPMTFLQRGVAAVVVLSLLGAVTAWLISRSITLPVRRLHEASEQIARGNYATRIDLHRSDELGILASGFNWMADQVQTSHDELREQYETAHRLAGELEAANRSLERAIEEAERSRDEAEAANQAKSDFLATMSHEIRTPINAIIGYTDLLQIGLSGPVTPQQEAQLERIRVSGRHLAALVDQVLDLARVEAGSYRLDRSVAGAQEAIETAITVVRPQAATKGVAVVRDSLATGRLLYSGDPQAVEQVLVNLLSNAIKFTEQGGTSTVRCGRGVPAEGVARKGGEWIYVSVEDTGIGIAADQRLRIFEPFIQVDSGYTRRHGGAGLGLAIARKLARSMGGDISVESEPGRGSSFTLWLRAAEPRPGAGKREGEGAPADRGHDPQAAP